MLKKTVQALKVFVCILAIFNILLEISFVVGVVININRPNFFSTMIFTSTIKHIVILIFSLTLVKFLTTSDLKKRVNSLKLMGYTTAILGFLDFIYKFRNKGYALISDGFVYEAPFMYFVCAFICLVYYNNLINNSNK